MIVTEPAVRLAVEHAVPVEEAQHLIDRLGSYAKAHAVVVMARTLNRSPLTLLPACKVVAKPIMVPHAPPHDGLLFAGRW